jgi:hypothetical protein
VRFLAVMKNSDPRLTVRSTESGRDILPHCAYELTLNLSELSSSDMIACLCKARHVQWPLAHAVGKLHAQPSVYAPYSELQAAEIALALQPAAEAALQQIMSHYRARDVDSFISAARSIYDKATAGAEALRAAFTVIEIRCCRNVNGIGGSDALLAEIDSDRGLALWVIVLEKCLAAWVDMAATSLAISSSASSGDQGGSSSGSSNSSGCSGLASMMGSAAFGLYQFLLIRAVCMLRRLPPPPLNLVERVRRSLEMLLASEQIVAYHSEHVAVHTLWMCLAIRADPDTLNRGAAPRNWVASAAAHRNNRKYAKHILQQLFGASRLLLVSSTASSFSCRTIASLSADSVVEPTVAVETLPLVAPNAIAAAAESRSDCSVVEWLPGDCNDVEFDAACRSSTTCARDGGRLPLPIGWSRKSATTNTEAKTVADEAAFQRSVSRPSSAAGGSTAAIASVPPPSFMLLQQPDVDRIVSLAAQALSLAAGAKQAADECRSLLLRVGIDAAQTTTAEEDDPRQERGGGTA